MDMHGWLFDVAEAVAIVNLAVSIAIAIHGGYTARQKVAQIALVWLVPALGSMVFGLFLWTQRGSAPLQRASSDAPDRTLALLEAAKSIDRQNG